MHYEVEVTMMPGVTRIVAADELVDLRNQRLLVGEPREVTDEELAELQEQADTETPATVEPDQPAEPVTEKAEPGNRRAGRTEKATTTAAKADDTPKD